MNQTRMYALDGARGIAAFCILLFHVAGSRIHIFGSLHIAVDFFFVLSGFVLAPAVARVTDIYQAGQFLVSRFIRIFPMVLAVLAFTLLYDITILVKHWVFNQTPSRPVILNIVTIVISVLMLQVFYKPAQWVDVPIWSLSAEWLANILVSIFYSFTSKGKYLSMGIGASMILISGIFEIGVLNQTGRALFGFTVGLLASDALKILSSFRKTLVMTMGSLAPIYFLIPSLGEYEALATVWPFAAWIVFLAQLHFPVKVSNSFSRMGEYSYGFYLWHFPMLAMVGYLLGFVGISDRAWLHTFLLIILGSVISVIATKVSLTLIEEPFRRYWVRKLKMV